jgi:hypothetical protein
MDKKSPVDIDRRRIDSSLAPTAGKRTFVFKSAIFFICTTIDITPVQVGLTRGLRGSDGDDGQQQPASRHLPLPALWELSLAALTGATPAGLTN